MEAVQKPYRIIISGGGTGGHIYPAIAIAHALQDLYSDTEILFVGAKGRMEMQKVPEAGYKIIGLWISGIQRKLTLDNLAFPLKVTSSLIGSLKILSDFRPNAVVGVGGFASGPLLYTASWKNIPSLLQEQNSYAGLTNKLLAGKVKKVCVAQEGMEQFFPKEKIVFTGNPVRKDIVALAAQGLESKRDEAFKYFDLDPKKKTLLVVGGSLGARTLNESMIAGVGKLVAKEIQVIWQCGKFYHEEMRAKLTAMDQKQGIRLNEFLNRMDLAYAAADVVVSRAGALAISELALVKKPTIFVPSPNVAEDHQRKNAETLVKQDAALMVMDRDAPAQLIDVALGLLQDEQQQKALSEHFAKLARPQAAEHIAKEVISLIQQKR
ncbi:undecaprenyldiphospho-muramoylpentapeptide beta-N-acetylglucosaminyltransferase [Catalinimonas niigatensis]|uniref:undecaprenyldiphospho-muramoylpentapeptide beta-N-acetylglucosaminyltransferase n=1 Tax=Catalinimonas niigatensis TaxID=1397264 RepID=UPI0026655BF2|nr:undecaprenyldiphospho-muramoylpentapeptide beta-N-acetylglucosaminyltransferase [Catalinimonas niigatensis]WPP53175.1 undecaprenyldiphospho-muramoylpentapeptide beta-N-acetylglucosaminyltransferase [Catalinimonas niigatensis]